MNISPLVLDLILVIIIMSTTIICGKRGFYKILMPLIVFVAAVVCAGFLSNTFKAPVTDVVFPKVETKVVQALEKAEFKTASPDEFLQGAIAVLPEGLQPMAQRLEESLLEIFVPTIDPEAAVLTAARSLTEAVVRIVLWVVLFLVGLVVFSLLKKLLGLIFKLPVISWLNHLGGAILGLGFSIFALYALGWILAAFGVTTLHTLGEGTYLFSLFF